VRGTSPTSPTPTPLHTRTSPLLPACCLPAAPRLGRDALDVACGPLQTCSWMFATLAIRHPDHLHCQLRGAAARQHGRRGQAGHHYARGAARGMRCRAGAAYDEPRTLTKRARCRRPRCLLRRCPVLQPAPAARALGRLLHGRRRRAGGHQGERRYAELQRARWTRAPC